MLNRSFLGRSGAPENSQCVGKRIENNTRISASRLHATPLVRDRQSRHHDSAEMLSQFVRHAIKSLPDLILGNWVKVVSRRIVRDDDIPILNLFIGETLPDVTGKDPRRLLRCSACLHPSALGLPNVFVPTDRVPHFLAERRRSTIPKEGRLRDWVAVVLVALVRIPHNGTVNQAGNPLPRGDAGGSKTTATQPGEPSLKFSHP